MKVHIVHAPADRSTIDLRERNDRPRHTIFVDLQGWEALRRPDNRDIDTFDTADAAHLTLTDGDELAGGSRVTPLDRPSLLQTAFSGLVQEDLPASPSLGADWTRFHVRPDRREGRHRVQESAALFCAMMKYALLAGYSYIAVVSTMHMLEHGTSLGWRITPLGTSALIAAWIEVNEQALGNARRTTGQSTSLLAETAKRRPAPTDLHLAY